MPDEGLSAIEELWNKLIRSGTGSLRNINSREQARSALADAIRSFIQKKVEKQPGAEQYVDEFAQGVARAIVETEPLEQSFRSAQELLQEVSSYLDQRLLIPPRMRAAAEGIAGKTVPSTQLAATQSTVSASAVAARALDDRFQQRVQQKFSFSPSVALDPTVSFVRKVDAAYQVTITRFDATVRLHTGFTIDKPLTSAATLDARAGIDFSPRPGLSGYVRASSHFDDLYGRPRLTGSQLGAGLAANLGHNATLNLDYTASNVFGGGRTDHGVFLGIKVRF
jgi:hypothetical protein